MSGVKVLSGLLPICFRCKKIRDDEGYWGQVEVFIHKHFEAGPDVFRAELDGEPVNLGEPVNSGADERDPFVAADGRVLLFASLQRPDGAGLYVSFRQADGWSAPRFLGGAYDVNRFDSGPRLSLPPR